MRPRLLRPALLLLAAAVPFAAPAAAQPDARPSAVPGPTPGGASEPGATGPGATRLDAAEPVGRLVAQRERAERAHLTRLAVWAGASLAGGAALALGGARGSSRRAFGVQTAAWGAVNAAIAAYGLTREPSPVPTVAEARRREDGFHDLLLLNEGLNVAYVATGVTMALAARRGVRSADAWRGHGWAVAVQGAMLLALDGVALAASRDRLGALDRVTVVVPSGAAPGVGVGVRIGGR